MLAECLRLSGTFSNPFIICQGFFSELHATVRLCCSGCRVGCWEFWRCFTHAKAMDGVAFIRLHENAFVWVCSVLMGHQEYMYIYICRYVYMCTVYKLVRAFAYFECCLQFECSHVQRYSIGKLCRKHCWKTHRVRIAEYALLAFQIIVGTYTTYRWIVVVKSSVLYQAAPSGRRVPPRLVLYKSEYHSVFMCKLFNRMNTTIVLGAHRPDKLFIKHTTERKRYPRRHHPFILHAASAIARKLNFDLQPPGTTRTENCNQRRGKAH